MARAYFQVYFSYEEPLKSLTYEQIGKIFMAMFQYEKTKEKPELDPVSDMAFYFIRSQMDRDQQAYLASRHFTVYFAFLYWYWGENIQAL